MMEWQRIARHRLHLRKVTDVHGKSIYTDAQMHTYLQQFERDFAQYEREGLTIVDATEGGVAKQHTIAMPLADFLDRHAGRTLPALPAPAPRNLDDARLTAVRRRLSEVRRDVHHLRVISQKTESLLGTMLADQADQAKMAGHFQRIEKYRKEVEARFETFELINQLNQMGVFKRLKADRKLHMQRNLNPQARQRAQLERDLENVDWIADAAQEMLDQLELAERLLDGKPVEASAKTSNRPDDVGRAVSAVKDQRIAALVAIDADRNGLGIARSLGEDFKGLPVLQATLERLGSSRAIDSIVLLVASDQRPTIESLIDRQRVRLPVEIETCEGSPFGPEHEAIAAARVWADTSWRGGIAGMSIYDEVLCPKIMSEIMQRRGLTAALIVGPDWPLIDVDSPEGCDAVVRRHLENPRQHSLVFTQAPPGLCGCVIGAALMQELAQRNRLSTVGGILVYQPHAPQHDPIAREANVQINHQVRNSLVRATFDTPRRCELIRQSVPASTANSAAIVQSLERAIACGAACPAFATPQHITIELCTDRISCGIFRAGFGGIRERANLTPDLAQRIFNELRQSPDTVITLGGAGDPLLHHHFVEIVRSAKSAGIRCINVRTELLCDPPASTRSTRTMLDLLLNCGVDVITVDLHADLAATYQIMMGIDRFKEVLIKIEHLLAHRRRLTDHPGTAAICMPWIVPCLQRRAETYQDIDSFFDRWQHTLGAALIEGPPPHSNDTLAPAVTPRQVIRRDAQRCMSILSNGDVPIEWRDFRGGNIVGNVADAAIAELWRELQIKRAALAGGST
jgi:hypothetical protein